MSEVSEAERVVMLCPLCGRGLTNGDASKYGRYRCPSCFESSAEAKRGWLPTAATTPAGAVPPVSGLTRIMGGDPWFSAGTDGKPITRQRTCECGRAFTQRLLSARFLAIAERQGPRALAAVTKDIPEYFVPVHCPPCERRDLGHAARLADSRREFGPMHGERDAAD